LMFWNCMSRHSLSEHFRVHGAVLNLFDKSPPLDMQTGYLQPCGPRADTIGFQFVSSSLAYRQKIRRQKVLGITVDRQTQFNGAQVKTYEVQSKISAALRGNGDDRIKYLAHPFLRGVREDTETLIAHFPERELAIEESSRSFGLQVTDVYLWLLNRWYCPDHSCGVTFESADLQAGEKAP
jgi:hypothetical protein